MASLQLRGESFACNFCYRGKRQWLTLGKVTIAAKARDAPPVARLLPGEVSAAE